MANQQAYLGQSGAVYYNDATLGWYPAPNDTLPLGGVLCPAMYVTDDPIYDLNVPNKKYVDKVVLFELNADKDIQPKKRYEANSTAYYNIVPTTQISGLLTVGRTYKILDWITDDDFVNVGGANVDGTVFVATGTTPTHWAHSSKLVGYQNLGSAVLPWDKIYVTNAYVVGINVSGLTASIPVITDGSKNLVSIAYTGATSFRKNLGLETDDSPTFAGLGATPIVTSYAGPHAIGGAVVLTRQYNFTGSFTGSGLVAGIRLASSLTPTGSSSAWGSYLGPTLNMVAAQTHPLFVSVEIVPPIINTASGSTITEATTLRIAAAPTAGVSNYALNVAAGASRFGSLTASLPIVTNSDKVLASLAYTGATSFRKNLGLETDDSPTFTNLTLSNVLYVSNPTVDSNNLAKFKSQSLNSGEFTQVFVGKEETADQGVYLRYYYTTGGSNGVFSIFHYGDSSTVSLNFLKGGNIGIGTAVPGNLLTLQKNGDGIRIESATDPTGYYLKIIQNYSFAHPVSFIQYNSSAVEGEFLGIYGGADRYTVLGLIGNVGINDTAPGERLDVVGNINLTGVLKIDDVQVVSNRVVDATIDNGIEAAFTALYPLASALLAGIQTAIKTHGLMAAA